MDEAHDVNLYGLLEEPPLTVSLVLYSGEAVKSKSPAEFFADNQNIAGFDNVRRKLRYRV